MERTERFYKIQQLLQNRRFVTRQEFLDALEVSPATFKRDLEYLRDRFQAPIIYDAEHEAYRFDDKVADSAVWELPGLWFSAEELVALLTMDRLLADLEPGVLSEVIGPFRKRIRYLLGIRRTERRGSRTPHPRAGDGRACHRAGQLPHDLDRAAVAAAPPDPPQPPAGWRRARTRDLATAPRALPRQLVRGRVLQKLHISEQTVKSHCNRIYKKVGVSDRLQLAIYVYKLWPDWSYARAGIGR